MGQTVCYKGQSVISYKGEKAGGRFWAGQKVCVRVKKISKILGQGGLAALVLVAGLAAYGYLVDTRPQLHRLPAKARIWPVHTQTLTLASHQPRLDLFGETVAGRQVALRVHVAGEVKSTGRGLREGAIVKRGEVLLQIDPFAYEVALEDARAALAEARARLDEIRASIALERASLSALKEQYRLARRDYVRARKLARRGTVSRKLADDRKVLLSQRQEALERARNTIKVLKTRARQQEAAITRQAARLRQARRDLEKTVLRAPFSAYVTNVSAQRGRVMNINDAVATLLDRKRLDVRFTLSDSQYGRLITSAGGLLGRAVKVRWQAGGRPLVYKAAIERVAAQIDPKSGGVAVYARLKDPLSPVPLRPGTFVEISLPDRRFQNVAKVPQTAIYGGSYLFTVENGRLRRQKIKVVATEGAHVLVRGKTLSDGAALLVTRLTAAADGVKVRIVPGAARNGQGAPATAPARGPLPMGRTSTSEKSAG